MVRHPGDVWQYLGTFVLVLTWQEVYWHQVGRAQDAAKHHGSPQEQRIVWPRRPVDYSAIKRKAFESVLTR